MPALTEIDIEESERSLTLSHLALSRSETSSPAPGVTVSFADSRLSDVDSESIFELILDRDLTETDVCLLLGICLRKVRKTVNIQVVDKGCSGNTGSQGTCAK